MNCDRLLALYHVCIAWHGGQSSPLYRLQSAIFPRLISPCNSEQFPITLDGEGYEEAKRLYGVYAIALGGCREGSSYMPCACDGCEDDNIIGEEWERGILRCDACRENDCGHRGCECPREEEEEDRSHVVAEHWLCVDCMIMAVNGDASGIESEKRVARIEKGLTDLGTNVVPDFDSETGEGHEEFSNRGCDCCGSGLAGEFYRFATIKIGDDQ